MATLILAVLGAGIGLGVYLLLAARDPVEESRGRPNSREHDARVPMRKLAGATLAAVAVFVLTGWPVGAVIAAAGQWYLPAMLGPDRGYQQRLATIDAVATFTEMLRDTLTAASGLNQALTVACRNAPSAIRPAADSLTRQLQEPGVKTRDALRTFAHEIGDPTADLVALALAHAAEHPTRDLAALLGSLAATAREQAAMRTRITVARARTRTAVRVVVGTTLGLAAILLVADRRFLEPFATAEGQLVLLLIGGLFAAGFCWLAQLGRVREPGRLWAPDPRGESV